MTRRKKFKNEVAIQLESYSYPKEICKLDIGSFPLIEDFKVLVKYTNQFGYHVYFTSEEHGLLASFPWWDHAERDLKIMDITKIPLGTLSSPFDDLEQSWQILIWARRDYVYIMEGEEPCCTEFSIWFKLKKEKYIEEWEHILHKFK